MDKEIFMTGMAKLMATYPDYPVREGTLDVYWEFLRSISNLDFERSVRQHITAKKWFPKVSEIFEAAQSLLPSPIDIWNKLLAAAETGVLPELDGPTTKAMEACGGWEKIQFTPLDDLQWLFKTFREVLLESRARETLALAGGESVKRLEG